MPSDESVFGLGSDKTVKWQWTRCICPAIGIFMIVAVTVLGGYYSYNVVYDLQHRKFTKDYSALADSAVLLLRKGLDDKIQGARALSAVISGAFPTINEWPFVYLNNFDKIATTISPATQISFAPIVTPEEVPKFEAFANRSFQATFGPELSREFFGIGIFAPVHKSCFTCARYHDISGKTKYGSLYRIMTPVLQGNFSSLMYNLHADPLRGNTIDKVISCAAEAANVTSIDGCGAITNPTFAFLFPDTVASIVFYPVVPALNATSLGGMTVVGLKWNDILNTLFPATVSGIYCVLRADALAFTFVITDGAVSAVLTEDAHDATLAQYAREAPVTAMDFLQSPVSSYTLTFYPTTTFTRRYIDQGPVWTALIVVFAVLAITGAGGSCLYFYWMRRRAAESETMAKAKRLFIRYISHEIRTPLNTVSLGLNLLLSEMSGGIPTSSYDNSITSPDSRSKPSILIASPAKFSGGGGKSGSNPEWRKLVAELIENSQCAVMLLDDLLSFEQLEATRRGNIDAQSRRQNGDHNQAVPDPLEMQVLPVWELVRMAISSFSVRARLSDVTLVSETEIDKSDLSGERRAAMDGLRILGNEAQLRRVVGSLLGNALQYSHEGGEIHVTTCWIDKSDREKAATNSVLASTRSRSLSRMYTQSRPRSSTRGESLSSGSWESNRAGMVRAGIVRVAVTDQGAGMTAEQTAQVFSKGRRFAINSLQAGQGTGIGLFVCKIIAEQHHASIRVTSPGLGLGSTYLLDLPVFATPPSPEHSGSLVSVKSSVPMQNFMQQPVSPRLATVKFKELTPVRESTELSKGEEEIKDTVSQRNEAEAPVLQAPVFTNKRILVVDDAPSNRKMLIRVLAKSGHLCEQAQDGQVALDMVEAAGPFNPFDMILMDYEMPVMNGPTATRLLRERNCTCPIVGVTGNVLSADVEFFIAQGADAVLPKPLQIAALEAVWRRKVEEEQQLQRDLSLSFEV